MDDLQEMSEKISNLLDSARAKEKTMIITQKELMEHLKEYGFDTSFRYTELTVCVLNLVLQKCKEMIDAKLADIQREADEPSKEFEPYWSVVDDGGHGVEVKRLRLKDVPLSSLLGSSELKYSPSQKAGHETDFSILDEKGNMYKAFWKGKAE